MTETRHSDMRMWKDIYKKFDSKEKMLHGNKSKCNMIKLSNAVLITEATNYQILCDVTENEGRNKALKDYILPAVLSVVLSQSQHHWHDTVNTNFCRSESS